MTHVSPHTSFIIMIILRLHLFDQIYYKLRNYIHHLIAYIQQCMNLYNADAIHIYIFRGLTGKRLVAYRSQTAGHVDILKADVAWNVHHMEKLIVPIPLQ